MDGFGGEVEGRVGGAVEGVCPLQRVVFEARAFEEEDRELDEDDGAGVFADGLGDGELVFGWGRGRRA